MQEIAELVRIWLEGGSWADIRAAQGFQILVLTVCWAVPASIIAAAFGVDSWRQLPIAWVAGFRPNLADEEGWVESARDLDKDGTPDI